MPSCRAPSRAAGISDKLMARAVVEEKKERSEIKNGRSACAVRVGWLICADAADAALPLASSSCALDVLAEPL